MVLDPVTKSRRRYYTLDGMRGVAALCVVVYHFTQGNVRTFTSGYLAVDFFFMLSGFVITLNYESKLESYLSFRKFIVARFIRLYPLFFIGLTIGISVLALKIFTGNESYGNNVFLGVILNLFFLPSVTTGSLFPVNGAQWSLLAEIILSFAFGLILYRLKLVSLLLIAGLAAAALLFYRPTFDSLDVGWAWNNAFAGLLRGFFAFPIGMVLARLLPIAPLRTTYAAAIPCLVLVAILSAAPKSLETYEFSIAFVGFPILLIIAAQIEPPVSIRKLFSLLGDISYPVYAIHAPLVAVGLAITVRVDTGYYIGASFFALGIVFLALAIGKYIDSPVRIWLSRSVGARLSALDQVITAPLGGLEASDKRHVDG